MTRVIVEAGICGFITTVEATRTGKRTVSVVVKSDCEAVAELNGDLQELTWTEALGKPGESVVWKCVCEHIHHPSCPVVIGILKAIEAELDLAIPRDVAIRFEDTKAENGESS